MGSDYTLSGQLLTFYHGTRDRPLANKPNPGLLLLLLQADYDFCLILINHRIDLISEMEAHYGQLMLSRSSLLKNYLVRFKTWVHH